MFAIPAVPRCAAALAALALLPAVAGAQDNNTHNTAGSSGFHIKWGFEAKANVRSSDRNSFPSPFPFPPELLPPGQTQGFESTVDPGTHVEVSVFTLSLQASWSETLNAHAKVDIIDLYDRNPTSGDKTIDVDELWLRFGRETLPAVLPERPSAYLKIGKFPHFERQNDRHLESYGLVSTAFNRFEDTGVEVGMDLGRHLYAKFSATQGNPVFMRDPNALAGDNGLDPDESSPLGTGFVILYDAEVEDLDADSDLELGGGLGIRFADEEGRRGADFLVWGYRRNLADTVDLEGTFYGGDLDLLLGPGNAFPLPVTSDDKREVGANLWLYSGGFSLFGQYVSQEIAGLDRTGYELELAWGFDLPVHWAAGGRQLFPRIAPAFRYSKLDPDFEGGDQRYPAVSVRWEWEKFDYGVRLTIVEGIDLTLEYADNQFVTKRGKRDNNEFLTTLRWKM